ncbi:MAG: hypothetical protein ACPGWR_32830, partial [Ardenticatenaceae bacterium]
SSQRSGTGALLCTLRVGIRLRWIGIRLRWIGIRLRWIGIRLRWTGVWWSKRSVDHFLELFQA